MSEAAEKNRRMARVIAKAWADEDYKQRLIADPLAILKAEGIDTPEGISIRVIEDSPTERTIILPPPPSDAEGIEDLEERAAAVPIIL